MNCKKAYFVQESVNSGSLANKLPLILPNAEPVCENYGAIELMNISYTNFNFLKLFSDVMSMLL